MRRASATTWDDLRFALAVGRRRSHKAAARALNVDPTTVGRRLSVLERALQTRLFERTPSGLEPTQEGRAFLAHAERVEQEILAAERELGGADAKVSGSVRITAGDGIVHYVLIPALSELRRMHPGISIEFRADTRALDLSRREADIAIRLARPKEPALIARRFGGTRFALYASRSYLERRGTPRALEDLAAHDFIGFDAALDDLPQLRWLRRNVPAPRWCVRATTTTAQVLACAEGLGIALLATFVAREPRLVSVLPGVEPPVRPTWLVVHQDMRRRARVEAVMDWLASTEPMLDPHGAK
jgi:DNA-binding transcriptional LysR family regulator